MLALPKNNQELATEYELLRQEIEGIDNQIKQLQEHHSSLLIAKESIESIKNQSGAELLVPGGAGVYFNALLNNDNTCLLNVGANIIIEMSIKKALNTINERIEQALRMIVNLNDEAESMVKRVQDIEKALRS